MENNLKKLPRPHQARRVSRVRSPASNSAESAPQVFLRAFVRALILNTSVYQEAVRRQQKATVLVQNRVPTPPQAIQSTPETITTTFRPTVQLSSTPQRAQPLLTPSRPRPLFNQPLRQGMIPRPTAPPAQPIVTFTNHIIMKYLADHAVQSLECPGPGKPLVMVRQNRPQVTNDTLDETAVQAFLQEIAEKTKIPLGEGLYKAMLGPYIITAVLSDIIGNRWIIQRRA